MSELLTKDADFLSEQDKDHRLLEKLAKILTKTGQQNLKDASNLICKRIDEFTAQDLHI